MTHLSLWRSSVTRIVAVLGVVLAAIMFSPGTASAHASLIGSEPSYGSTMAAAPATVRLVFDNPVEPGLVKVRLKDDAGVEIGKATLVGERVPSASIEFTLPAHTTGSFRISWVTFAFDGHVVSGTIPYTIDPSYVAPSTDTSGAAPTNGAPSDGTAISGNTNKTIDIVEIQARFFFYIAMAALFGALGWILLLRSTSNGEAAVDNDVVGATQLLQRHATTTILISSMAAAVIALLRGGIVAWRLLDAGYDSNSLLRMLYEGNIGGYALAGGLLIGIWFSSQNWIKLALGAAACALTAALGHAGSAAGSGINTLLMAAHLTLSLAWAGMVCQLAYVASDKSFTTVENRWLELRPALDRLGKYLLVGFAVIGISGARAAVVYSDGIPSGRWGATLAVKLAVVAGVCGIGLYHYLRGRQGKGLGTWTLVCEAGLLVIVLTTAAVLSTTNV
jgi:methionine-rich copper-binding protein CopC/putative copper export protein